jgi:hypothetical protein
MAQVPLFSGLIEPSLCAVPAVQVLVPVFLIVMLTAYLWPAATVAGTLCEMNCAALVPLTPTATLGVSSPKLVAARAICQRKFTAPLTGVETLKLKTAFWPDATALPSSTRVRPQLLLSWGFWLRR